MDDFVRTYKLVTFAEWLGARVSERGVGVNQLATYSGVGASTVSRWLSGRSTPEPPSCYKIAEYFNREPEEVLAVAGHLKRSPEELNILTLAGQLRSLQRSMGKQQYMMEQIAEALDALVKAETADR